MPYLWDDGLVAPPAPWPGSVSGPHWLAAAPRTPSLLSQACPGVVLSPPPIWHIAGLSPRACERRVGGLLGGGEDAGSSQVNALEEVSDLALACSKQSAVHQIK